MEEIPDVTFTDEGSSGLLKDKEAVARKLEGKERSDSDPDVTVESNPYDRED